MKQTSRPTGRERSARALETTVGVGHASFVVADGKAYTIEQRRSQEVVAAYDMNNGRELWTQKWSAEYTDSTGDGPRATPTWDRAASMHSARPASCVVSTQQRLSDLGQEYSHDNQARIFRGRMAASPLIVDDKVIVLARRATGKSVVAYNKMTGAPVWKVARRSASVRVADAGRTGRTPPDRRRQFIPCGGLAPENGDCCGVIRGTLTMASTSRSRSWSIESFLHFVRLWKGAALVEVKGSGEQFHRVDDLGKQEHEEQV
jgi:hypothetical protein